MILNMCVKVPFGSVFFLFNPTSGAYDTPGSSIGPSGVDSTDLLLSSSVGNTSILQLQQN